MTASARVSVNARFWSAWSTLAWLVPSVVLIGRLALGGGWEVLILWVWSPAIVVVF